MQGIVTGIGFLGAGVILRPAGGNRVRGLTTAACTWLAAAFGIACAVSEWRFVFVSVVLAFAVLVLGGPFEKILQRWLGDEAAEPLSRRRADRSRRRRRPPAGSQICRTC